VVVNLDSPDQSDLFHCRFSPNGRFVACAAGTTIYVWDISTLGARLVRQLAGHPNPVTFIAFSSSLISGSWDGLVKFWQSSDLLEESIVTDHVAVPHDPTWIESANLFAKECIVVTSDSSGVVKTWDLMTGGHKSSFSTPAQGIRDTHLAGDTLTIVWCADKEMEYHMWDVYKGQLLRSFRCSSSVLKDLKISGDGSKIFGLDDDGIKSMCVQTGEETGHVDLWAGEGHNLFVYGFNVGINGSRGRGWNFEGPEVSDFGEFPDGIRLDFVDSAREYGVKPRWIEDTVTRKPVFRLPEGYMRSDMEAELDGRFLLFWSRSGEMMIMDFDSVYPR
jgi:WD40 repeat protein